MSTVTWTATLGGNWASLFDWSAAPTASDDILITQPGTYVITESVAETAHSLLLDAPGATLVLDAPLTIADGVMLNAGTVVFSGGELSAGSVDLNGATLTGNTVAVDASGTIGLHSGSIIAPYATLTDQGGILTLPALTPVQTAGPTAAIPTNWTLAANAGQFSPALGTLISVDTGLTASVGADISVESLESGPSTVSVTVPDTATLSTPGGTILDSVALPPATASGTLGGAGLAGRFLVLTPSASGSAADTYQPNSPDAALFSGGGTVALSVSDAASLSVTGPANMAVNASASATAGVSLQYAYSPVALGNVIYSDGSTSGGITTVSINPALPVLLGGETTRPQVFTFPDQITGWHDTVPIQQFNSALGTLESVNITLSGDIRATDAAENKDNTPATVATTQTATVTLTLPAGAPVSVGPSVTDTMALGALDGFVEFAGASGRVDQGLTQTATTQVTDTNLADLNAFQGRGTVAAHIADLGAGTITGPANLVATLLAQGGATVTVDYSYLPATLDTWTAAANGDWGDGGDWSSAPNAPAATARVAITQAGTYAITASVAEMAGAVLLNAPNATLVLDAPLDVENGFTLLAGTVVFAGGTLSAGSVDLLGGHVFGGNVDISSLEPIIRDVPIDASGTVSLTEQGQITAGPIGSVVATGAVSTTGVVGSAPTIYGPVVLLTSGGSIVPADTVVQGNVPLATGGQGTPLALVAASPTNPGSIVLAGTSAPENVTGATAGGDPAVTPVTGPQPLPATTPIPSTMEFDAAYYLAENPDVAASGMDPLTHFDTYGWKEGRNPDPYFNVDYYLNQNPDVAASGMNPLDHYELYGWHEGRDPSANFSTDLYLQSNPDVSAAGIDPLMHYLEWGAPEGRMAFIATPHAVGAQNPLVDNNYYFSQYADVRAAGVDPFTHYDTFGWKEGRNPDALFDTQYYLQHNPDVAASGMDPLIHYETYGWKEGRDPSAEFSTRKYLAANPDVAAAGMDPLIHYEEYGIHEGRSIYAA